MRIAYFTDSYLPYVSGIVTSVNDYTRKLTERGHKVMIFAPAPAPKKKPALVKGIQVVWLPSMKMRVFYPDFRIAAPTAKAFLTLKKFKPDIIHVHTQLLVGWEGILSAKLLNVPYVFTFHLYFMDPASLKSVGIRQKVPILEKSLWNFARNFSKNTKIVICPTNHVLNDLKKNKFPNRLTHVPSGIDLTNIKVSKKIGQKLRMEHDIQGPVILGVGRLSKQKNWELLLAAHKHLYDQGKRYTLVMIGKGPSEKELRFLSQVLETEHRVRFLGEIPHSELLSKGYYNLGDIFAMPSTYETQGIVTLEAMAHGLPVVALKSKGTIELIQDIGLFARNNEADFAHKLEKVLGNTRLYTKMSKASLRQAMQYSIDVLIEKLEKVYQQAMRI